MSLRIPTKTDFDRIRFVIRSVFEILLMVLAIIAVIVGAWKHIP